MTVSARFAELRRLFEQVCDLPPEARRAALGEATGAPDTWVLRLYYKPFISWIWAGCLLMALGGLCAALDGRYRRKTDPKVTP